MKKIIITVEVSREDNFTHELLEALDVAEAFKWHVMGSLELVGLENFTVSATESNADITEAEKPLQEVFNEILAILDANGCYMSAELGPFDETDEPYLVRRYEHSLEKIKFEQQYIDED